jgi:hypothetical protein
MIAIAAAIYYIHLMITTPGLSWYERGKLFGHALLNLALGLSGFVADSGELLSVAKWVPQAVEFVEAMGGLVRHGHRGAEAARSSTSRSARLYRDPVELSESRALAAKRCSTGLGCRAELQELVAIGEPLDKATSPCSKLGSDHPISAALFEGKRWPHGHTRTRFRYRVIVDGPDNDFKPRPFDLHHRWLRRHGHWLYRGFPLR